MKIAIISDSHDNVTNLEKLIEWLNRNKISILIHAGDLCAPGVLKKTLAPEFKGQIHMIAGNVHDDATLEKVASQFSHVKYYGEKGEIEIDSKKIAFVHFKEEAEKLVAENKYNLVIFGHTHQSEIQKIKKTQLVNPGTMGGLYNKATFVLYDTKTEEIKIKELDNL